MKQRKHYPNYDVLHCKPIIIFNIYPNCDVLHCKPIIIFIIYPNCDVLHCKSIIIFIIYLNCNVVNPSLSPSSIRAVTYCIANPKIQAHPEYPSSMHYFHSCQTKYLRPIKTIEDIYQFLRKHTYTHRSSYVMTINLSNDISITSKCDTFHIFIA